MYFVLLTVTTISFLIIATASSITKPALAVNQTQQEEIEEKALELIKSTESYHWDEKDEWTESDEEEDEDK